ncbi:MAG: 16S rRNA (guanine(966)-N(2))-methyltransferase RsmD [Lachnospiraceae bacterium]|nr:16S rRNA (guanine(966)-N(2))-methyltransferase RsmD [Lachnospiraceae bacterium]
MRVIAGAARRILLKTVEGMDTRPTTDRIKETLFNILQPDLPGARVLDLFSGSGALGIEALSRGSSYCVFVEKAPEAVRCIQANLSATHLEEKSRVMSTDVQSALSRLDGAEKPFDLVLMDPPYHKGLELEALARLADSSLIDEYTIIVVETALDTELDEVSDLGYHVYRVKDYKTNRHFFLQRK